MRTCGLKNLTCESSDVVVANANKGDGITLATGPPGVNVLAGPAIAEVVSNAEATTNNAI